MNRYQKLITQIVKDDLKNLVSVTLGTTFRESRKRFRKMFKNDDLDYIRYFKNFRRERMECKKVAERLLKKREELRKFE